MITTAIKRINLHPHTEIHYSNITVSTLPLGQHINIFMLHPVHGMQNLELLSIELNRFLVLHADDCSLLAGDELISLSLKWNLNHSIDFYVYRNSSRFPDEDTILRTAEVRYFELYNPSPVYEILDSQSDFKITTKKEEESDTEAELSSPSSYGLYPSMQIPMAAFKETDIVPYQNAPYIISMNKSSVASFSINTKWFTKGTYEYFIENPLAKSTFETQNKIEKDKTIKKIKVIKKGLLKRVIDTETRQKVWMIKRKLYLKLIY